MGDKKQLGCLIVEHCVADLQDIFSLEDIHEQDCQDYLTPYNWGDSQVESTGMSPRWRLLYLWFWDYCIIWQDWFIDSKWILLINCICTCHVFIRFISYLEAVLNLQKMQWIFMPWFQKCVTEYLNHFSRGDVSWTLCYLNHTNILLDCSEGYKNKISLN